MQIQLSDLNNLRLDKININFSLNRSLLTGKMKAENKKYFYKAPNLAFTLIELSIVLVIIGLIVGGILVARDMIDAAKLRDTYSRFIELDTAINTFRLKYNTLPGDTNKAYTFFGGQSYCTSTTTCNGDNNGQISYIEERKFLLHLALAGLIPMLQYDPSNVAGNYTVASGADTTFYPTRYPGAGITATYTLWTPITSGIPECQPKRGSYLAATKIDQTTLTNDNTGHLLSGFLSIAQVRQLDTKFDDGKGRLGKLWGYGANCTANYLACPWWADPYMTNNTNPDSCALIYWLNW